LQSFRALIVVALVTRRKTASGHIFSERTREREGAQKDRMGTKLFVGNLAYSITEQELREAFGQGGRTVQSVRIALDRETQRPRGFAFIELANDTEADDAIKE